jgi:hypothetical protein
VKVELSDPTTKPIPTAIRSTKHIPGVKGIDETVTVPAGVSVVMDVP